jgi:secretion/DNA translocation related TadE-like protein
MSDENGSGSVLGLAIAASAIATLGLLVPLYSGLGIRESVAEAADASALAAADVAAGAFPGVPCDVAARAAAANHAVLEECEVDGLVVTVRTSAGFLGLTLAANATAGPPFAVTN